MKSCLFVGLLILAGSVGAQEAAFCYKKCDQERAQCRFSSDARIQTDTHRPLQIDLDKTRDVQTILADDQRASGAERGLRSERYSDCDRVFSLCQSDCRSAGTSAVDILIRK